MRSTTFYQFYHLSRTQALLTLQSKVEDICKGILFIEDLLSKMVEESILASTLEHYGTAIKECHC